MKKSAMLLMLSLCANAASAQIYVPQERVTTFTQGEKYMIYNTAMAGSEDRTGFITNNGTGVGHSGAGFTPNSFCTQDNKYFWEITPTAKTTADNTACEYHVKSVKSNTYVGPMGATNNATGVNMYIQPWTTSKTTKSGVSSKDHDGKVTANKDITDANKVFTISGSLTPNGANCWNGDRGAWNKWSDAHPYAIYKVVEARTKQDITNFAAAQNKVNPYMLQRLYGVEAAKYTSNATSTQEGSLANLVDGNYDSYFHSEYSKLIKAAHYIQVELPAAKNAFAFYFKKRKQNNNNRPTSIKIEGSNDNAKFETIQTISTGLPTAADQLDYYSQKIQSKNTYKYIRFTVTATNSGAKDGQGVQNAPANDRNVFFTFSEFYLVTDASAIDFISKKNELDAVYHNYNGKTSADFNTALNAFNTQGAAIELAAKKLEYNDKLNNYKRHIGEGINCYSGTTWEALSQLNQTLQQAQTSVDLQNAAKALDAELAKLQMNQPIAGRFYRLRCTDGNRYLTQDYDATKTTRLHMQNDQAKAVLLLRGEDQSLLAYNNGQYFGNTGKNNDFAYLTVGAKGQPFEFKNGEQLGSYGVKAGVRYIYGASNATDSGNGRDSRKGYDWWLEEVKELPVTITAAGWASLYAPVALNIPAGVTAYTAQKSGNVLLLTAVNTTIPAKTPVLLEGAEGNYKFTIDYASQVAAPTTSLTGSLETVAATTVQNTFTLQQQNGVVGFYPYNGTNLQGFRAYGVSLLDAQAAAGLTFVFDGETTGIEGVAGNNNKQQVIYDLSGRRVLKAQKGLYIVNGKKVMIR